MERLKKLQHRLYYNRVDFELSQISLAVRPQKLPVPPPSLTIPYIWSLASCYRLPQPYTSQFGAHRPLNLRPKLCLSKFSSACCILGVLDICFFYYKTFQ